MGNTDTFHWFCSFSIPTSRINFYLATHGNVIMVGRGREGWRERGGGGKEAYTCAGIL